MMENEKTVEQLVRILRDRVGSYAVAIIDLEALLAVEREKTSELEAKISELEGSKEEQLSSKTKSKD